MNEECGDVIYIEKKRVWVNVWKCMVKINIAFWYEGKKNSTKCFNKNVKHPCRPANNLDLLEVFLCFYCCSLAFSILCVCLAKNRRCSNSITQHQQHYTSIAKIRLHSESKLEM